MVAAKRVEPQKRVDPKRRHIDGSSTAWTQVVGRDPNRHYVLVATSADEGPDFYESIGYQVEVYGGDRGLRLKGGNVNKSPGSPIEMRGHLLMSCTLERKAEIEQYGPDGDSGQEAADEIERRLSLNKGRGRDALRGLGVKGEDYLSFESDISAPVHEYLTV